MADKSDDAFVSYEQKDHFSPGTLLNHLKFGKGIVLSVEDHKIEVLFADSKKRLVMDAVRV
jgi:hypothetical protein